MKSLVLIFLCLLPVALCWEYPGYPGVDCPTAAKKIREDPESQWAVPKCNPDGTFQDMQCNDKYPDVPDICFCTAPDGSPLTLPGFGLDVESCVCWQAQYEAYIKHGDTDDLPKCEKNGYFSPLQCKPSIGECWCVDQNGNILVPPSKDVHSCN